MEPQQLQASILIMRLSKEELTGKHWRQHYIALHLLVYKVRTNSMLTQSLIIRAEIIYEAIVQSEPTPFQFIAP